MRTRIPSTAWVDVPLVQEKAILPLLDLVGTAQPAHRTPGD
jgi:hypothetical protein